MDTEISDIEREFLRQSNAIESIYDDESLRKAEEAWVYIRGMSRLHSSNIKKTHRILMAGKLPRHALGHWRSVPVFVGYSQPLPHWILREAMSYWAKKANEALSEAQIIDHHVTYEKIHPFLDGNGRTGRIFMNWQLLKNGFPVKIFYEKDKNRDYYPLFK